MIVHCSQKLAAKLKEVSDAPLAETSPLGSWHGHLFTLDRRQCMMFCHDVTRYTLFASGNGQWKNLWLGDEMREAVGRL